MNRRSFLTTTGAVAATALASARGSQAPAARNAANPEITVPKARFRTGLVAYSYRQALQSKAMTYEDSVPRGR